jgi:hypothetical protein
MSAARVRELPEAAIGGPRRLAGRDPAATRPGGPAGPATGPRRAGIAVAGLARRLRGLPGSVDFRQLAGPAAVFFLWPPRPGRRAAGPAPGAYTGGNGRYQGRTKPRTAARAGDYQDGRAAS